MGAGGEFHDVPAVHCITWAVVRYRTGPGTERKYHSVLGLHERSIVGFPDGVIDFRPDLLAACVNRSHVLAARRVDLENALGQVPVLGRIDVHRCACVFEVHGCNAATAGA